MEELPEQLIVEILGRLSDARDLARCRLVSRTFRALSYLVHSVSIVSSPLASQHQTSGTTAVPFTALAGRFLRPLTRLEAVRVAVDEPRLGPFGDGSREEDDDLFLVDVGFVSGWIPATCGGLRSISISSYWPQSCWRRSTVLAVVSSYCSVLLNLELKNAWLSVERMKRMPMLTSLTLEYIRLDDENLDCLNSCFPALQKLNLIDVGGLKDPKLQFSELKTCHWVASNCPTSLTIDTPNLIELRLRCVKPRRFILKAPSLFSFFLSMSNIGDIFEVERFLNLRTLRVESADLFGIIPLFSGTETIENLICEKSSFFVSHGTLKQDVRGFKDVVCAATNVRTLSLGPVAWSELQESFYKGDLKIWWSWEHLKKLVVHLLIKDVNAVCSFISFVLTRSAALAEVALFIHCDVGQDVRNCLISRCTSDFPRVRWKWGSWSELYGGSAASSS
ncbi:F-box/LRR-repeat protein At4g29420 [Nymphaea colorata]|nr:F-box/LRR-repeat protein At4g29420 [Nymphaea colorata]